MSKDQNTPDDLDPTLVAMEPVLEVTPTLRGRILEIMLSLLIAIGCIYLLKKIPPYGTYLDTLLGFKLGLLHIKLSYAVLAWPIKIVATISSLFGFYVFLQQKLTKYRLTDLYLEYTRGVLVRNSDSTDLVSIRDQKLTRTLLDRILGISRLLIISKDVTDPEMMVKGISADDAQKMMNFLRKYAFQNYTEWRISKEKEAVREARKKPKKGDLLNFEDYGDDN